MPPHPTFYTYKDLYVQYGFFDVSYQISSDYEMMLKLLYQNNLRAKYIPKVLVKMQSGGISNSLQNLWLKTREDYTIMKKNNFNLFTLFFKTARKLGQLFIWIRQ
jgi:glycosyltransferase